VFTGWVRVAVHQVSDLTRCRWTVFLLTPMVFAMASTVYSLASYIWRATFTLSGVMTAGSSDRAQTQPAPHDLEEEPPSAVFVPMASETLETHLFALEILAPGSQVAE
jgi:hypothetical protein